MSLQEKLMTDLAEAMKKGETTRRSVIRLVRAGIKNAEIEKGAPLDDEGVVGVIAKDVRAHRESIAEFRKGNRQDLVAKEEAELAVLLEYMPPQMSRDEIMAVAQETIREVGAQSPKDMGKVMGKLMPQLRGRAEGQEVNAVVSELLASFSQG